MARETLLKGQDSRLVKVVLEVEVPVAYYDPEIVMRKLEDFVLGPTMIGWDHPDCFTVRTEEQADAKIELRS